MKDGQEWPDFYQFLYQVRADESLAPGLREVVNTSGKVIQKEIRRLIVEGQATGEIAKDDPDQLMAALMAVIDGVVKWAPLYKAESNDPFPSAEIILRLLRPDNGDHAR